MANKDKILSRFQLLEVLSQQLKSPDLDPKVCLQMIKLFARINDQLHGKLKGRLTENSAWVNMLTSVERKQLERIEKGEVEKTKREQQIAAMEQRKAMTAKTGVDLVGIQLKEELEKRGALAAVAVKPEGGSDDKL